MKVVKDVPYLTDGHERHVLDIYSTEGAKNLPVVFWIHGGGWQVGDKSEVKSKPQLFVDHGCVFVSTNYRLLPQVDMATIVKDIASSIHWVHDHIAEHGGDPKQLLVMGHSAGAQLAALICTDERYLKAEGLSLQIIKGCVPVDGDTYDIPAIITTAEIRRWVHKQPQAKFGHREKFGNDPEKHIDFSAVTHVTKGKGIPPFLLIHVGEHPDTSAQATRLATVLKEAEIPARQFGGRDTSHSRINDNIGTADDPTTKVLLEFVEECAGASRILPKTVLERLKTPINLEFSRKPLQEVFAYMGDKTKVTIVIDGDALKSDGYTKNMPQTFSLGNCAATKGILTILTAPTQEKLCLVVNDAKMEALITTITAATDQKLTIVPLDSLK